MSAAATRFVVLEGIDGSGTTTQAKRLAEALEARGERVCLTCEPSSGPVGRLIREALTRKLVRPGTSEPHALPWSAMALLFAADRVDHVNTVVETALADGKIVVSDRYVLSSLAYQSVTSPDRERSIPWIRDINAHARPADLTIVLDVDDAVAAERRALRGGPEELFEAREIQRKLAGVYRRAEELLPGARVVHVEDGSPDAVAARIWDAVARG